MKKLISVFAAMALVGSVAAAPKKPAPAPAKAPAAPAVAAPAVTVTAPSASSMAVAGKGMGLSFGLSLGLATDIFKQGDKLKNTAGVAGGGGLEATVKNANSANTGAAGSGCSVPFDGGTTAVVSCSASGTGSSVSLNAIDIGARVQYDILPWLFVRTGGNYYLGLKNTYTATRTNNLGATTITDNATLTVTGSIIEIPGLIGFNLLNSNNGTLYFAGGVAYSIGTYEQTLSASQTRTVGVATTYHDVTNTTKFSGLGLMAVIGGKVKVADGISVFGEMKILSSAGVGSGNVTGTAQNAALTTTAATAGGLTAANGFGSVANGGPQLQQGNSTTAGFTATNGSGTGGLDFSYTRWQVGVNYEL